MQQWFGEPWPRADFRAPVCEDDALRIPTPVGSTCLLCEQLIDEGDRGTQTGYVGLDGRQKMVSHICYVHTECTLRSILGNLKHHLGQCRYIGQCNEENRPFREEALELWAHLHPELA